MADPNNDARLARVNAVIGALADLHGRRVASYDMLGAHVGVPGGAATIHVLWRPRGPDEALEVLCTRGLWPWEPSGEGAARWWCAPCEGTGVVFAARSGRRYDCHACTPPCATCEGADRVLATYSADVDVPCEDCGGTGSQADALRGWTVEPPSMTSVVAVAALGGEGLVVAAHLADVIAPGALVVWRVMTGAAIEEHHRVAREEWSRNRHKRSPSLHEAFSAGHPFGYNVRAEVWRPGSEARRAWPAICALAMGDGDEPRPTGVHLLHSEPAGGGGLTRLVLGAEGVP